MQSAAMITRRDVLIGAGSAAFGVSTAEILRFLSDDPMTLRINTLVPDQLSDSIALDPQDGYSISSAFARLVVSTEATTLRLTTYNDSQDQFSAITKIGIWVDGVYLTSFSPADEGFYDFYLGLDVGAKEVAFVAGPQSLPTGQPLIGSYLVSLIANKPLTHVLENPASRLVVYGDSIAVGDGAGTAVQQSAWPVQVRAAYDGSVALEAWGYRSLKEDYDTDPTFADLVSRLAQHSPTSVWLAIGTNCYALNKWAAAALGAAYAVLLDKIHTELPDCAIYAQTPILRATETANSFGDTTGDYRTAIAGACSGRAWATLVDGTSFLTTDDLADGTHPNVTGHGKIATAVLAELA